MLDETNCAIVMTRPDSALSRAQKLDELRVSENHGTELRTLTAQRPRSCEAHKTSELTHNSVSLKASCKSRSAMALSFSSIAGFLLCGTKIPATWASKQSVAAVRQALNPYRLGTNCK